MKFIAKATVDNTNNEDLEYFSNHSIGLFNKIIWTNIANYNYRAQLDIAELLFENFKTSKPLSPIAHNLIFRIYQLYFEAIDQLALVCKMILEARERPACDTYFSADNKSIRSFYRRAKEGLPLSEAKKLYGIDNVDLSVFTKNKDRDEYSKGMDSSARAIRENLKTIASLYIEIEETGNSRYSGQQIASTSIKHGYKVAMFDENIQKIMKMEPGESVVLQGFIDATDKNTSENKPLLKGGYISKEHATEEYIRKLVKQIEFVSKDIKVIAEIQSSMTDDPRGNIRVFYERGIFKLRHGDRCACGSGRKAIKCHARIT